MLTLPPQPSQPVRKDTGRDELDRIWESLDPEGRRLLMAHAKALLEVTSRGRRPEPRL